MAKNIKINGVTYNSVSSLSIPLDAGGGDAVFPDTSDATAAAGDIASGKTAYVGGSKVTGTATGGGGGTPTPVSPKDVNFYDYEGTRVASYTLAEAQALTALPDQPTRSGLTGQGWNYTLAQVNAADRPMDVGAMYITDDGKTRLYIRLDKRLDVPLYFSQTVANSVTIDWGDGSSETKAGTGNKNITHTYAVGGDYMISLDPASGTLGLGNGSSTTAVIGGSSGYQTTLYKAEIGQRVTSIGSYAFYGCSLSSISIPNSVTSIGNSAFSTCYSLSSISIPNSVTSIGNYAFQSCQSLSSISIPSSVTSIGNSTFNGCRSLSSIIISSGVTSIGSDAFSSCYSLSSISIPSSVTSIGNSAFYSCTFMKEYHFKRTTPPTLGGTSVFYNIPSDCIIYVPAASLATYKYATNWSTHAAKMVGE